jgi:hypothetical protein
VYSPLAVLGPRLRCRRHPGIMAIWSLMFVIGSLGWVGLLLGIMLGRPWLVYSLETTSVQVVPLVALPYFLVCYLASFELCGGGAYIDGAAFRAVPADPDAASSTPAVLFAALFTQGLMQVYLVHQRAH